MAANYICVHCEWNDAVTRLRAGLTLFGLELAKVFEQAGFRSRPR